MTRMGEDAFGGFGAGRPWAGKLEPYPVRGIALDLLIF